MKQKAFYILRIVIFTLVILSFLATAIAFAQDPAAGVATTEDTETVAASEEAVTTVAELTSEQLWADGNEAYNSKDYSRAATLYGTILARGEYSARLYYNMGNACFKSGNLAGAVLNYKRALRLAPANEDARYNLALAEAQTKDKIVAVPEFFLKRWTRELRDALGCTAWSVMSVVCFAAALALLLLFLLANRIPVRKTGFYGTVAAALLFVATTSFAVSSRESILANDEAVVMATAIPVKASPDRSATDLFVLHAGTSVRVIAEVDEWREIVIADGKRGWVESRNIEVI